MVLKEYELLPGVHAEAGEAGQRYPNPSLSCSSLPLDDPSGSQRLGQPVEVSFPGHKVRLGKWELNRW